MLSVLFFYGKNNNNSCLILQSSSFKKVVYSANLKINECRRCGLYSVPPKKDNGDVSQYFKNYDMKKYISYYKGFRKKIYKNNWCQIKKWTNSVNSLVFGSSFWWLLEVAPIGCNVYVVDPAQVANIRRNELMTLIQVTKEEISKFGSIFN